MAIKKTTYIFSSALSFLLSAFGLLHGQNIELNKYSGEREIKTYNGIIGLKSGFVTPKGARVDIFISKSPVTPPVTPPGAYSSASGNYIRTWTATAPISDPNTLTSGTLQQVKQVTQYFDGLGRPLQTVAKQGSLTTGGSPIDLVSPVLYDEFGREPYKYLPYAGGGSDGSFKTDPFNQQASFYKAASSPLAGQNETYFYSKTNFEASPLNRVEKILPAGNSWSGSNRGVETKYWINTAADNVRIWDATFPTSLGSFGTYTTTRAYQPGTLYKNVTVDEHGKQIIEFKDTEGQLVLKKVQNTATADDGNGRDHTGWLCTYYIYDDLNNLRCVIQPRGLEIMASSSLTLTQSLLDEQCFRYEYDGRRRMILKKVPGAEPVYMVYDTRDRLVMTQDGDLRAIGKWLVNVYDDINRPQETYLLTNSTPFTAHLASAANSSSYPTLAGATVELFSQTNYDTYTGLPAGLSSSFLPAADPYFEQENLSTFPYPVKPQKNTKITTKGLVTWAQNKSLGSSTLLASVNIYDDEGQVIQTQSQNATGGVDVITTQYTWSGQPLVIVTREERKGSQPRNTISVVRNTYDALGRVVKVEERTADSRFNNGAMSAAYVTILENEYDALGQVKTKKLGKQRNPDGTYATTPLEAQNHEYNIRGWLLGVNRAYTRSVSSPLSTMSAPENTRGGESFTEASELQIAAAPPGGFWFGFDLGYDQTRNNLINNATYKKPLFNGNITGMVWKSAGDGQVRRYDFDYDATNRLTGADFNQYTSSSFNKTANIDFSVSNLRYDANGNILNMNQSGLRSNKTSALIDQLIYTYLPGSNKLAKVADAIKNNAAEGLGDFQDGTNTGDDYAYDPNGNLIKDENKKITSITYNHLNLPVQITVAGKGTITYTYDATGRKLQKKTVDNTVTPARTTITDYMGNSVYQNDTLQFIYTQTGRKRPVANGYVYDHYLTDHLGNVRAVITDEPNSPVLLEENSYTPWGLTMKNLGRVATGNLTNRYKYNGKELQSDLGLDQYDYGARFYDPKIGRWHTSDPLAELGRRWSPYTYAFNNPIIFVDPDGMWGDFWDQNGRYLGNDGIDDKKIYVLKTTETKFDSGVPSAGISKDQSNATKDFIKTNSGNTDAFKNNSIAYDNSVEIEGSATTRQGMVDVAKNDKGSDPSNLHEYGAAISKNGTVGPTETGPTIDPKNQKYASVEITTNGSTKSIMHTHPSYFKEEGRAPSGTIQMSGEITTTKYEQAPSDRDINNAGSRTNYTFGMRNGTVYIYNSNGVQATIPLKRFVDPKK